MTRRLVEVFTTFETLTDPRIHRTRRHELFDMVVVALCGTIAGGSTWADIERFGNERLAWLQTFLKLENGVPSHDTFGRVFSLLEPAKLMACVQQWLEDLGRQIGEHIAIDGKTLRGAFERAAGQNPLHLVSAWASEARLTLGQVATDAKSNEITAIPLLLELLSLKGATVTIDAMGCQKEIAQKIVAQQGTICWRSRTIIPSCIRRWAKRLPRRWKPTPRHATCDNTSPWKPTAAARNAANTTCCRRPKACPALPIGQA
jgi:hypothetical protein